MRILIQGGVVVNGEGQAAADVLVENGRIEAVEKGLNALADHVIQAEGCYVLPGFIDTHTHFDLDLGTVVTADNFPTGTRAAILGGTTTVLDFATQDRGGTMTAALQAWHEKARGSSCNYGFHMAVAEWNESLGAEMEHMATEGVTSFKMYMVYPAMRVEDGEIYCALQRAKALNVLVGMHCENYGLLNACIAEQKAMGRLGPSAHPLSRPAIVEAEAVSRYLRIAELAGAAAYVVHLSAGEGLIEARRARERGQKVYLETCPQYLVLDDSRYLDGDGAKFVMSPPLRKQEDILALWQGLSQEEIQTVGTDHCSFTMAQKALGEYDFTKIPNGGAGVQNRAALYHTFGVKAGHVTMEQMAAQLSENAAKLFGMYPQKGALQAGADGDIVVWDPAYSETITHKALAHNCDNSPYEGIAVWGRARDVLLNGEWVVRNGELTLPGQGRYIKRGSCQEV